MDDLEKAIAIALQAHEGVLDKSGKPYILHPLRLMMQMDSEEARITAVLHDVVEDSAISLTDLAASGFSSEIIDALALLTHDKEATPYEDYIQGIKSNPLARQVKLADLEHNMDTRRLQAPLSERDLDRLQRYRLAWDVLADPREF
jgi:(p)ppGpp synthase/HD superfamily hydrolase